MKKTILLSTFLASQMLMAEEGTTNSGIACQYEQNFKCESYTAPYYNLQCDCGGFVAVDFLYWYGRESLTDFAIEMTLQDVEPEPDMIQGQLVYNVASAWSKIVNFGVDWDPGVRVAIGFNNGQCDGWDLGLVWTYFCNTRTDKYSVPGFSFEEIYRGLVQPPVLNSTWNQYVLPIGDNQTAFPGDVESGLFAKGMFDSVNAKWEFKYNKLDLQLGRRYWVTECMTFRPFMSLTAAWTDTVLRVRSKAQVPTLGDYSQKKGINTKDMLDKFDNCSWGVGFASGFAANWHMGCGFSIKGEFEYNLLWGDLEMKKTYDYFAQRALESPPVVHVYYDEKHVYKDKYAAMQSLFGTSLGLNWESFYCCNRYHFALFAGWEHNFFLRLNHRKKYRSLTSGHPVGSVAGSNVWVASDANIPSDINGNVQFGGFVLNAQFDF